MLTRTNIHTPHPASLSPTSHKNWISDTELLHRKRSVPSTRMIVTTRLRPGNTSVLSVGNGLTVRAASRFITIPIPGNAVSARPFPPFHSFERTDLLTRVSRLCFTPAAYLCPYPGCLRTFNVSSNMRRHYKNHEFVAANRPQLQMTTLQPSFYSPPLQRDPYPPPPLQCGFR